MGVFSLWDILLTVAQNCPIDKLSGRILAIDASIWIVKTSSLFQEDKQKLKCILDKIVVLKRNNVLPVFVFDGEPPALKRKTLEGRRRKRIVANDLEVKKKAEIQVVKALQKQQKKDQKGKRQLQNEVKISQINQVLQNLKQFQQKEELSEEAIQKLRLQSDILTSKYLLMLDIDQQLKNWPNFMQVDAFGRLDIQSKLFLIEELQEYKWKNIKQLRRGKNRSSLDLTPQEKVLQDLQIIEKKSLVRQLQDSLYRKTMMNNVRIEDGFQIMEGIYNGKKVIQKRRIPKPQENSYLRGRNKKMKNDFSTIMGGCKEDIKQKDEYEDSPDMFLAQFCVNSIQKSQPSRKSNSISPQKHERQREMIQKDDQKDLLIRIEYDPIDQVNISQEQQQNLIKKRQNWQAQQAGKVSPNQKQEHHEDNPDNLPEFRHEAVQNSLPSSSQNLQLQNFLKLLGIPFVIAPSEAEAECADLEIKNLVDGVITQDSDVFLFGARNVFRGVFQNNIRFYGSSKIQQRLRLDRQKLIIFALLLGSDYTDGVKGIGVVNAMEIIKVFNTFQKLQNFKKWAQHADILLSNQEKTHNICQVSEAEEKQFYQLHKKFKNYWFVDPTFPKRSVIDAYLKPEVLGESILRNIKKQKMFSLSEPNLPVIETILRQKLRMHQKQIDFYLKLIRLPFKRDGQTTLIDYFARKPQQDRLAEIKSKRLQRSLQQRNKEDDQLI